MKRIIVAGGRDFSDRSLMVGKMDFLISEGDIILSGMASGADELAWDIGNKWGYKVEEHPADWGNYGKSAGPIRNQEMALAADVLIAFWDGKSRGTKDMIEKAVHAGLEIHVYRYKPNRVVA